MNTHDLGPEVLARVLIMGNEAVKHTVALTKVAPVLAGMLWIWANEHVHASALCFGALRQRGKLASLADKRFAGPATQVNHPDAGRFSINKVDANSLATCH